MNNGVEISDIVRFRRPYRSQDRADRILFIGRVTEKAELKTLLSAIERPGCECLEIDVIGSGPLEVEAKRIAANSGLEGRVRWHGEIVDERRIAEIANLCKVFVYPGSVGLSLIHALAFGLPCVVHGDRSGHMPEFAALQNDINGTYLSPRRPRRLGKYIAFYSLEFAGTGSYVRGSDIDNSCKFQHRRYGKTVHQGSPSNAGGLAEE